MNEFYCFKFKSVDGVVLSVDLDMTQCETIQSLHPKSYDSYYLAIANGGDLNNKSKPEAPVCLEFGIELVDGR